MICGYAPQSGISLEEKTVFYDKLKYEWDMHCADDLVMCLGYFNGHIGRHIDGFDEVHGGHAISVLSGDGIMCVKYMVYERGKEEGDIQNG